MNRRILACGLLLALAVSTRARAAERPNFVVVLADDLGFSDLGAYGSEIPTPHLDRLAREGLRFTQFYNTAKCETGRRTLLSGLWHPEYRPQRTNGGRGGERNNRHLAERLRDAGYGTYMAGKWHIDAEPLDRGFDRYFGHLSGATDFFHGDDTFRIDREPFAVPKEGFYTTDANTDHALRFLDEAKASEKPFFLYLAYNAPHYPLQAPRDLVEKHRGRYRIGWDELRRRRYARQLELGVIEARWKLSPRPDDVRAWDELTEEEKDLEDLKMATFAAMIDRLDQSIGRIVEKLEAIGARENTVILFFSDNGGCPFDRSHDTQIPVWEGGGHWTYHKAWAGASNTPFRWYKQNNHEGGIATPMIASWPRGMRELPDAPRKDGRLVDEVAHLIDVVPTCLELAGVKQEPGKPDEPIEGTLPLRGVSFAGVLRGRPRDAATRDRPLFWHFAKNRAVRVGDWKLASAVGGPWELYHLREDRTELHDLAKKEPERAAELAARWEAWAKEVGVGQGKRRAREKSAER